MKKRRKIISKKHHPTKNSKIDWKILIASFILVYLVAFFGSMITNQSVNSSWYDHIKPSITPPDFIFPIIWNLLFIFIAVSLYLAFVHSKRSHVKIMSIFGINLILNLLWSILFFGLRNPRLAFYDIILLWISIIGMIFTTWSISKKSSLLLIPYLLWVSFAMYLNYLMIF